MGAMATFQGGCATVPWAYKALVGHGTGEGNVKRIEELMRVFGNIVFLADGFSGFG
jgi:hypothetical protein